MFVDEVDVHVTAGAGGRGCLAFRREIRVPRGGPSGGDGGHGGSIYIVASPHTNTLINYRFHPEFDAERGQHGQGSNRTGHAGENLELAVPVGTLVYEKSADGDEPLQLLADLAHDGDLVVVAEEWATHDSPPPPIGHLEKCNRENQGKKRTCISS